MLVTFALRSCARRIPHNIVSLYTVWSMDWELGIVFARCSVKAMCDLSWFYATNVLIIYGSSLRLTTTVQTRTFCTWLYIKSCFIVVQKLAVNRRPTDLLHIQCCSTRSKACTMHRRSSSNAPLIFTCPLHLNLYDWCCKSLGMWRTNRNTSNRWCAVSTHRTMCLVL